MSVYLRALPILAPWCMSTASALRLHGTLKGTAGTLNAVWNTGPDSPHVEESLRLLQKAALLKRANASSTDHPQQADARVAEAPLVVPPPISAAVTKRGTVQEGLHALEAASGMGAWAGRANCVAGLSVLAVLAFAFRSKLKELRQRRQGEGPLKAAAEPAIPENIAQEMADGREEPDLEAQDAPGLAETPPPMRRLRNIGASYVVPRARIERCCADSLNFDVPTLPCVWPLRAQLQRAGQKGPWERLQLTVDIIAASGLPPLLMCTRIGPRARPEDTGGTGGTGSLTDEGGLGAVAELDLSSPGDWASASNRSEEALEAAEHADGYIPWLKICNASGTVVVTIHRRADGSCVAERQDRSVWEIAAQLDAEAPWITVSRQGQEMGQATSLGHGKEHHLQLDTQPDVQSPESCMLLMCMLAVLVFDA